MKNVNEDGSTFDIGILYGMRDVLMNLTYRGARKDINPRKQLMLKVEVINLLWR